MTENVNLLNPLCTGTAGLSMCKCDAIKLRQGMPFTLTLGTPNTVTRQTFENTDAGRDLNVYAGLDEMFATLDEAVYAPD